MSNILIRLKDNIVNLKLTEVYYFFCYKNKVFAVTKEKKLKINCSLCKLENALGSNFFRSHRSYLINKNKIDKIIKYSNKSYNIEFKDIEDMAFITGEKLKELLDIMNINNTTDIE